MTERRRLEQERTRLESERAQVALDSAATKAASEAKDRFLAMLSHELRTPLTPILAAIAGLEPRSDVSAETRALLGLIQRNLRVETRLIDDLLDVTRIVNGKLEVRLETVDLHELVEEAIRTDVGPEEQGRHRIMLSLQAERHHVKADRVRLHQVLWNLLSNARRHTPKGGRISVLTKDGDASHVRLAVQDDGEGIEPEFLPRLFVPFTQGPFAHSALQPPGAPGGRRRGGLGLGLSICRGVIEAHGGTIDVSSAGFGCGTTFEIRLPVTTAERTIVEPTAERPEREHDPRKRPLRILVVEDHEDSATALAMCLRMKGFEVKVAGTVGEALKGGEDSPDLLISDLDLPDGTGHELLVRMRKNHPVAALALSGHASRDDVTKSKDAGFEEHLVKPVDMPTLLRAIARATGEDRTNGAAANSRK